MRRLCLAFVLLCAATTARAQLTPTVTLIKPDPRYTCVRVFGAVFPVNVPAKSEHGARYKNNTGAAGNFDVQCLFTLLHDRTGVNGGVESFGAGSITFVDVEGGVDLLAGQEYDFDLTVQEVGPLIKFPGAYYSKASSKMTLGPNTVTQTAERNWTVIVP